MKETLNHGWKSDDRAMVAEIRVIVGQYLGNGYFKVYSSEIQSHDHTANVHISDMS